MTDKPEFPDKSATILCHTFDPVPLRQIMFRVLFMVLVALITVMQSATLYAQQKPKQKPAMTVKVDRVVSQPLKQTVPVIGRLVPERSGVVAAEVNGAIETFNVKIGDRVKKGDILATLAKSRFQSRLNLERAKYQQFKARIATKIATVKLLKQELKRLQSLKNSPAFSQARLEDKTQEIVRAESEQAEAESEAQSALANLNLARIDLKNTDIVAPYNGVVTFRHSEVGAYVKTGDALVTLIDDGSLEIEADVPSLRIKGLIPGLQVPAKLSDGKELVATVRAVIPDENPQTRTRATRFQFQSSNDDFFLAANQSITLDIPVGKQRNVVTVHKDALIKSRGKNIIYIAVGDSFKPKQVQLGQSVGMRFIVINGLKPGDLAIVRGNERLRPGVKIAYTVPENP